MPFQKEVSARIKINRLLEKAGWRFFNEGQKPANIQLERGVKITQKDIDLVGEDFEQTKRGQYVFLPTLLGQDSGSWMA